MSISALCVVSEAICVGTFAADTTILVNSILKTICVDLKTLCLVLGAGVFECVASMWMASEVMGEDPIMQKAVPSEEKKAEYMYEVFSLPRNTLESTGHVVV